MTRERLARVALLLAAPALAFVLASAVGFLVLLAAGADPAEVIRETAAYLARPSSVVAVLNRATTYYLAGIAAAIGFRMLLFNIGIDGQYRLAVFAAAVVGGAVALPPPLHVGLQVVVAMVVGAVVGGDRGAAQGTARRLRGHQHDHAQRRRHRDHRVAARPGAVRHPRGGLQQRDHRPDPAVGTAPRDRHRRRRPVRLPRDRRARRHRLLGAPQPDRVRVRAPGQRLVARVRRPSAAWTRGG